VKTWHVLVLICCVYLLRYLPKICSRVRRSLVRNDLRRSRPVRFVCPSCLRGLPLVASFCRFCGCAASSYAATGPIEQIAATGEMYRRAIRHPNLTTLVGLWLLTLAGLLGLVVVARSASEEIPALAISGSAILLQTSVTHKATRAWLERAKSRPEASGAA
jgi:hypothetical protein